MTKIRFVGLDVHAETIAVAVAEPAGEVRSLGTIPNRPEAVRKLVKQLGPVDGLRICYEAGPTGYVIYWQLTALGVPCEVVAPTLVPTKAGDRVKTDRRDAEKLARSYRLRPGEAATRLRRLARAEHFENILRQIDCHGVRRHDHSLPMGRRDPQLRSCCGRTREESIPSLDAADLPSSSSGIFRVIHARAFEPALRAPCVGGRRQERSGSGVSMATR
jgi:transposase